MIIIAAIFLLALIALIVVGFATGFIKFSPARRGGLWSTRGTRAGESCRLFVTPDLICPRDDCTLEVEFDTITESAEATATLSVTTPAGNEIILSNALSGRIGLPGDDATFSDGPGLYVFKFVAEGLRDASIILRDDATLMTSGGHSLYHSSSVPFTAQSQVYERQLARETLVLGEGVFWKSQRRYAFCDKLTALSKLSHGFGGTRDLPLGVRVFNVATGEIIAAGDLSPGDALSISPAIPMSDGAAVEMSMSAYSGGLDPESNAFPIGSIVLWNIRLDLDCV